MDVRVSSLMSAPTQPARHALLDVSALVSGRPSATQALAHEVHQVAAEKWRCNDRALGVLLNVHPPVL